MTKGEKINRKPAPEGQLFEIHGSELELDPACNAVKPTVGSISHRVFFLGVCEDPLNGLTSPGVGFFAQG